MKQPTTTATDYRAMFDSSASLLSAKANFAVMTIYDYVEMAHNVANDKDSDYAARELAELRRQTEEAIEHGRHLNPVIKQFAVTVRTYKIDPELVLALFESLYMDVAKSAFRVKDYRKYIAGLGEATGLMVLRVLCYKRAVLYHKLIPAGRALGAGICKIVLLNEHGRTYKKHGHLHFPDITKATFNQARLAQIIVEIEADFRLARATLLQLPPSSKRAAVNIYAIYYDILNQMRQLSPAQIDAGKVEISKTKLKLLRLVTMISPVKILQRGSRY